MLEMAVEWSRLEGLLVTPLSMKLAINFMYLLVTIALVAAGGDDSRLVFQACARCLLYSPCLHCLTCHRIFFYFHFRHPKVLPNFCFVLIMDSSSGSDSASSSSWPSSAPSETSVYLRDYGVILNAWRFHTMPAAETVVLSTIRGMEIILIHG